LKQKIALLCFSEFSKEPRVLRTLDILAERFLIDVYSTGTPYAGVNSIDCLNDNIDFSYSAPKNKLAAKVTSFLDQYIKGHKFQSDKFFERQYWSEGRKNILKTIQEKKYSLIIGHGIYTVPILAELSKNNKTIFNAHEYYPEEFSENSLWKTYTQPYYRFILNSYLSRIHLMFCVSGNIQAEYQKHYQIRSEVITNATSYYELTNKQTGKPIKLIHHGAAIKSRKIELMAQMMEYFNDDYELYLMLVNTDNIYLAELKTRYGHIKNIHFMEPVSVSEIPLICNQFDIGLFILPPVNFNWLNALPNKLFEYVQARIAVAVSPNPDMKKMVQDHELGVVAEDYSPKAMAAKIIALNRADIDACKANSDKFARELSAESNKEKMKHLIHDLLLN
jgi:glycosyltransferase involved in cell wall biosynthesis